MAELLTYVVRGVQIAIGLVLLFIFLAPVAMWIWPFVWPILVLGLLIGLYMALDAWGNRLEAIRNAPRQ